MVNCFAEWGNERGLPRVRDIVPRTPRNRHLNGNWVPFRRCFNGLLVVLCNPISSPMVSYTRTDNLVFIARMEIKHLVVPSQRIEHETRNHVTIAALLRIPILHCCTCTVQPHLPFFANPTHPSYKASKLGLRPLTIILFAFASFYSQPTSLALRPLPKF